MTMIQSLLVLGLTGLIAFGCQTTPKRKNYVAVGNQYAKDGLLREAAESYKRALSKQAKNSTAHRNVGMVLVKLGEYKAAARHLEKAMRKYEKDFDANFYLAEAYRAQDKYADAIFRYQRALKIRAEDPRALKPLAWSYFKIRYYSEAMATTKRLAKVADDDDQVAIIMARTMLKLNRGREALSALRRGRATARKTSVPYYDSVEGDIHYALGDQRKAKNAYKAALKDQPLLAGALLGLGKCMLDENRNDLAIKFLERATRIRPNLAEAHYLLGRVYEDIDRQKAVRYYHYFRKQAATDPEFVEELTRVRERLGHLQRN